jgi:transcription elongation factor Elf1
MAELLFTCPITHRKVPTGIETDVASLRASWSTKLTIRCSHCGQTHETLVRETYVEGALDDAAARQGRAE